MANRAYKFKLKPTQEQADELYSAASANRWVWNQMLEANISEYASHKKFIWSKTFQNQLPKLKKDHPWLAGPASQSLQQTCDDLEKALRMSAKSRGAKQFGFPKFRKKYIWTPSFRIPQQQDQIKIRRTSIKIPKHGWIKWIRHRPIIGTVKSVTVKREKEIWYAIILAEIPDREAVIPAADQCVGIDLGLTVFATLSDGGSIQTPKFYRNQQEKLAIAQRRLSRKTKGSKNYQKQRRRVAAIHQRIANQRHNFVHQHSAAITKQYDGVFLEDLNIEGIKQRWGKSTSDQGWRMFVEALRYKAKHFSRIDQFAPSSKTCSRCGTYHQALSLSDRTMPCCGHDRDLNAAENIRRWGITNITAGTADGACGEVVPGSIAREIELNALLKQEKFIELNTVE